MLLVSMLFKQIILKLLKQLLLSAYWTLNDCLCGLVEFMATDPEVWVQFQIF
jgi:hypothetical protein